MPPPRAPLHATAYSTRTTAPFAHSSVTPSSSWQSPVTWWSHRTSTRSFAAMRSSRISSVRDWEMFTHGGRGERPGSAKLQENSSLSR
jgi:hypothetical protein